MARRQPLPIATLYLAIGLFIGVLAAPASANDLRSRADESFHRFARSWLNSVQELGGAAPSAVAGGDATRDRDGVVTIRVYGDEFTTELREVHLDGAEYVGILHYNETIYNCRRDATEICSEPSTVPVTEIFRYDDGRWY